MLGHGKGVPIGLSVEEHPMGWDTLPLIYITWTLLNIRGWKSGDFRGLCHSGGNAFFVQFQRPTKMTNHLWDHHQHQGAGYQAYDELSEVVHSSCH